MCKEWACVCRYEQRCVCVCVWGNVPEQVQWHPCVCVRGNVTNVCMGQPMNNQPREGLSAEGGIMVRCPRQWYIKGGGNMANRGGEWGTWVRTSNNVKGW